MLLVLKYNYDELKLLPQPIFLSSSGVIIKIDNMKKKTLIKKNIHLTRYFLIFSTIIIIMIIISRVTRTCIRGKCMCLIRMYDFQYIFCTIHFVDNVFSSYYINF